MEGAEFNTADSGTVLVKPGGTGTFENTGTVLITDTNTEGDTANDAFGVDTVIITENEDGIGTVRIKE